MRGRCHGGGIRGREALHPLTSTSSDTPGVSSCFSDTTPVEDTLAVRRREASELARPERHTDRR
jgi:hypothetical protein